MKYNRLCGSSWHIPECSSWHKNALAQVHEKKMLEFAGIFQILLGMFWPVDSWFWDVSFGSGSI
jgi:hypothetical protein